MAALGEVPVRLMNLIVQKDALNGRNRLGVVYNRRMLIEVEPTDEEMDQIQAMVMEIAARHV